MQHRLRRETTTTTWTTHSLTSLSGNSTLEAGASLVLTTVNTTVNTTVKPRTVPPPAAGLNARSWRN